jgi:nicotinate-nucleotide adenylyltransferase
MSVTSSGGTRVALFGGTFDPPHRGHLGIATAAADAFTLDTVLFAPVGLQPLKIGGETTSYEQRLAMVELMCATDHRFHASTIDAPHLNGAANYTVDTLAALHERMPATTLFNLAGADGFLTLRQWREPEKLLALAEWIVASRPGFPLDDLSALHLTTQERNRVHLLETVYEDVSATELRKRLATGGLCDDLLLPEVAEYIHQHGLYGVRK